MSYAEIDAPHGHDGFLLDDPQYHGVVRTYMESVASDADYSTFRFGAEVKRQVEERERQAHRADFATIAGWVTKKEQVLDLGCGDGSLLAYLARQRNAKGYGIEIADEGVLASVRNGINVLQSDLESGLAGFDDASFDCVILSQTLQAMRHTEEIVAEMLRVGREVIVTFPNFGRWTHRWQILKGRMPVSEKLPYQWYDTPNIHLCTVADFDAFLRERNCIIENRVVLAGGLRGQRAVQSAGRARDLPLPPRVRARAKKSGSKETRKPLTLLSVGKVESDPRFSRSDDRGRVPRGIRCRLCLAFHAISSRRTCRCTSFSVETIARRSSARAVDYEFFRACIAHAARRNRVLPSMRTS